jgi:hypothetical protein
MNRGYAKVLASSSRKGYLHRARLFFPEKPFPWTSPQAELAAARQLIEQCGYRRRKEELEDAEQAARN